jgi:hypothetical protein
MPPFAMIWSPNKKQWQAEGVSPAWLAHSQKFIG